MKATCIPVINFKGGVAKSVTVENASSALASKGKRVLAIDNDPQATLTKDFGFSPVELQKKKRTFFYALFNGIPMEDVIIKGSHFDIIPSSKIHGAQNVDDKIGKKALTALKEKLESVRENYDYILIDCPPYESLINSNALAAGDAIIVPVKTDARSVREVPALMQTVFKIRKNLNPTLKVLGILPTMYKGYAHDKEWLGVLERFCKKQGIHLFAPIRQSTKYEKAVDRNMPALQRWKQSLRADNYHKVAEYIIAQETGKA